MFKIVSPLSNVDEVKELISCKIDEIYFGVMSHSWLKENSNFSNMNSREFEFANLNSISEVNKIYELCKQNNIKTNITLNSSSYNNKQLKYIYYFLKQIKIDNVIVADLGLIKLIKSKFPKIGIHLSSLAPVFNYESIMFYKSQGVSRIILPRHISIEEILLFKKKIPQMEFEIFILNQGCTHINGFCNYLHGIPKIVKSKKNKITQKIISNNFIKNIFNISPEFFKKHIKQKLEIYDGCACLETYKITNLNTNETKIKPYITPEEFNIKCGICSLKKIEGIRNIYLKIVGREYTLEKKKKDIKFIKESLSKINEKNYINLNKQLYLKYFNKKCHNKNCYYE